MLKFKSPVTKLSSAIAFCLIASSASANTLYSTYHYLFNNDGSPKPVSSGTDTLESGQWTSGYFKINSTLCSNGCDLTGVALQLDGPQYSSFDPSNFAGIKLEIFSLKPSSNNIGMDLGSSLFELNNPGTVIFNGTFGTKIEFSANAQDQTAPALLQPNTAYWLKLSNINQTPEFGWFYNGIQANEYWNAHYGSGKGSPYIFEVEGVNSVTSRLAAPIVATPIPGAVWMMGSALMGLLAVRRRNKFN